jgi:cold shock CspA family protein
VPGLPSLLGAHEGRVTAFDVERGWGTVTTPGGDELFLHCTAIADGSRTIEVGTAVRLRVVPGRLGRWEAADVTPDASGVR